LISSHENSDNPQRSSFEDILLSSRLTDAVARINPTIPHDAQQEAIKEVSRIHSPELLPSNIQPAFGSGKCHIQIVFFLC
jgi:type I site-specific restriction-modification system R (restriction) subunit